LLELPCYVAWEVWKSRNINIFDNKFSSPSAVAFKALSQFNEFSGRRNLSLARRPLCPVFPDDIATRFFDGSSSQNGVVCACGVVLKLLNGNVFLLGLNVGSGTNSKAELLGLWVLLFFSRVQKLEHLQVYGDSKLMIDWDLNKCSFKMDSSGFLAT
jgi:hypothetical protein